MNDPIEKAVREGEEIERQLRIDATVNAVLGGLEGFHQLQEDGTVTFLNIDHLVSRAHEVAETSERERARRVGSRKQAIEDVALAAVPDASPAGESDES